MARPALSAKDRRERGAFIVGVIALLAILLILSGVAAQQWSDALRRDKEQEMIFRAQEMAKGLWRYRKDRGALPTELKMLLEPGSKGQYFVRRLYTDPLVKDGKWGLLYASPQGGVVDPNSPAPDTSGKITSESMFATGKVVGGLESAMKTASGATELAGLPIAGVKTLCKEKPFRVYNEQNEYALWQFTVFDVDKMLGLAPGANPASQAGGGTSPTGTPGAPPGARQSVPGRSPF